jgi:hypothetical protein
MPRPWTTAEIEATVAAYFEMLRLELSGVPYVKAEYNDRVRRMLDDRSKAAVEYKFQNMSAVLVNHGQVYVRGYLPAQNFQRALESAVLEWLEGHDDLVEVADRSPVLNPTPPSRIPAFSDVLHHPPDPRRIARPSTEPRPVKVDFVRRDAENRTIGAQGEEFVFELEQRRLQDDERRPDLARRVRWRARDDGDGLGSDILSFEGAGSERLIEVKTTGAGIYTQFALTRNELACSQRNADRYHLYRLFGFGPTPRLYTLRGALDETCTLTPTQFRASVGGRADGQPATSR